MSRVDEALRRAASVTRPDRRPRPLADRAADRVDPTALGHYPAEGPAVAAVATATAVAVEEPPPPVYEPDFQRGRLDPALFSEAYRGKLVVDAAASSRSIEQYRRLAASVDQLQGEHKLRRLMVSSAAPREGKTLTIVNLAMTLSESYGRRVLLIDGDLRKPAIHEVFGIPNHFGLCDALESERADIQLSRVSPRLWVLPAGRPTADPMTTLASRNMERLLDEIESSFDWVLLDAPPLGPIADAGLLVRLTRAVIVVIAAGSTQYGAVEKMVSEIGRDHVVGVVLNRADGNASQWSDYDGYPTGSASQVVAPRRPISRWFAPSQTKDRNPTP